MELSQQVTSLEPSKKLQALGVPQVSIFARTRDTGQVIPFPTEIALYPNGTDEKWNWVSAFTVAELGAMLPATFGTYKSKNGGWTCCEIEEGELKNVWALGGDTEADARALLLIHLLKHNLITL